MRPCRCSTASPASASSIPAAEQAAVSEVFQRVDVAERALWTRAGAFSGGNQQKIAIAKWLLAESRVMLLYDPTRGIDVGTKHELYKLMRAYAEAGGAILFYSTEIPELVHLADRVLVLYQGRVAEEIGADALNEDNDRTRRAWWLGCHREGGMTAVALDPVSPRRWGFRLAGFAA